MTQSWSTAWHIDSVRSVEQALILVLLLAPFLALWIVSAVRRRAVAREAEELPGPESSVSGAPRARSTVEPER